MITPTDDERDLITAAWRIATKTERRGVSHFEFTANDQRCVVMVFIGASGLALADAMAMDIQSCADETISIERID